MASTLARLTVPRLAIRPHHRLLEIGCGGGTAVAAVAEQLASGSILAIDRAGSAVARATQRNAAEIARGVARIVHVDLASLVAPASSFHTVFALNVSLFQTGELWAVELIRRVLRRHGRLVLGYSRFDQDVLAAMAERIMASLRAGGLADPQVEWAGPQHMFITASRP